MKYEIGKRMLFLSAWPWGVLREVVILGENKYIKDGIYIKYLDGRKNSDTTTKDFLYEYPQNSKPSILDVNTIMELNNIKYNKLLKENGGHGVVKCKVCNDVLIQCKCPNGNKDIFTICEKCKEN